MASVRVPQASNGLRHSCTAAPEMRVISVPPEVQTIHAPHGLRWSHGRQIQRFSECMEGMRTNTSVAQVIYIGVTESSTQPVSTNTCPGNSPFQDVLQILPLAVTDAPTWQS